MMRNDRKLVLQCDLCPKLFQLGVHVTRLNEIHLLLQLPVSAESTEGKWVGGGGGVTSPLTLLLISFLWSHFSFVCMYL